MSSELDKLIDEIKEIVPSGKGGLPYEFFLMISQYTPMVNVDLLIKNKIGHTLLTWRHDEFYGPGWHLPGGIIRFKENIHTRVSKVAESELGAKVRFCNSPIAVKELFAKNRDIRGHFISMLFLCELVSNPLEDKKCKGDDCNSGDWRWHRSCPENLISVHEVFRPQIEEKFDLDLIFNNI